MYEKKGRVKQKYMFIFFLLLLCTVLYTVVKVQSGVLCLYSEYKKI